VSNKKIISLTCYGHSVVVYIIIFLIGMLRDYPSLTAWGFVSFHLMMPILSFVTALVLNATNAYLKWLYPYFISVFGLAIATTVSYVKLSAYVIVSDTWRVCVISTFLGSLLGLLIRISLIIKSKKL